MPCCPQDQLLPFLWSVLGIILRVYRCTCIICWDIVGVSCSCHQILYGAKLLRSTIFTDWLSPRLFWKYFCGSRGAALDLLSDLKCDSNVEDFQGAYHVNICRNDKRRFGTEAMVHGCHVHIYNSGRHH